ncbi:Cadherin repeat domain-containing protein [Tenacibaculum sp. 190130A14a]|uniref:Cadherin repeat domain-containing protein n=1 Tax=Tenacibaculum polynesiense TaxID=3137857 RepID=A0ABP1F179_9FLAO
MKKIIALLGLALTVQLTSCSSDEVAEKNTAPVIVDQTFNVNPKSIISLQVVASDAENDELTYSIKKDDLSLFQITNAGKLSLKSSKLISIQKYLVDVEVTDGKLKSSATITVNVRRVAR